MGIKEDDDGKGVSVSVRVPNRTLFLIVMGFATGGVGLGTAMYQSAESSTTTACYASAERAENLAARAVNLATDAIARDTTRTAEVERLRADLQRRSDDRYTKIESDRINEASRREHDLFRQADASHDRQINQLDKDVEELRRMREK